MKLRLAVLALCGSLLPMTETLAQSNDANYCAALINLYRTYVGANRASGDVPMAIAACNAGDTATGIPVLEKALRDAQISLPPRNQ